MVKVDMSKHKESKDRSEKIIHIPRFSTVIQENDSKNSIGLKKQNSTSNKKALELGPLENMFPCSSSKIMDFLLTFREFDYSISDIAKYSGISLTIASNEIKKFEEQDIVVNSKNMGNISMYKINPNSEQTLAINKFVMAVATKRIESCIEMESHSLNQKKLKC